MIFFVTTNSNHQLATLSDCKEKLNKKKKKKKL